MARIDYSFHYDIQERLADEPNILPPVELYNFDDDRIIAFLLDRLGQPLRGGVESPFSSRNPLSAHGQLLDTLLYVQKLLGHELNLTPGAFWMQMFRLLGVELGLSEKPVISLTFKRSQQSMSRGLPARIPLGTKVVSNIRPNLVATTLQDLAIAGDDRIGSVAARLNQPSGILPSIRINEFSRFSQGLTFVEEAYNDGTVLFEGREAETVPDAMLRARQEFATGLRCVTARDFKRTAISAGAKKVNVISGGTKIGKISDLVTLAVYPITSTQLIRQLIRDRSLVTTRVDVIPAEIIPLTGVVKIRMVPYLTDQEAFEIAARAIQDKINPPNGKWGDLTFKASLATAIENQPQSFYSVPSIELRHAFTNEPIEQLSIKPWHLFEIQSSVKLEWLRSYS